MLVTDTKVEASLPSLVERLKPNTELKLEVSVETKLDKANLNQEGLSQVVCEQAYEKDKLARVDHTKPSMVEEREASEQFQEPGTKISQIKVSRNLGADPEPNLNAV